MTREHCLSIEPELFQIFFTPFLFGNRSKMWEPFAFLIHFFCLVSNWRKIRVCSQPIFIVVGNFEGHIMQYVFVFCVTPTPGATICELIIFIYILSIPVNSTANMGNISFEEFLILHIRSFKVELGLRIFPSHVFHFWQQRKDIMVFWTTVSNCFILT